MHAGVAQGEVAQGAGARSLALQLPPNLLSTTLGELVKCTYTINVQIKVRVWLLLTNLETLNQVHS